MIQTTSRLRSRWRRRRPFVVGLFALFAIAVGRAPARVIYRRFEYQRLGGKWRAEWFQAPDAPRDRLPMTARIEAHLALRAGDRVADIGAGRGYWTFRIAERVGPTGEVDALDTDPEMLAIIERRARARGLVNVRTRRVSVGSPALAPGSRDRVLMVNTYAFWRGDEPATLAYLAEVRRALRPGGRFVFARDEPLTCDDPHGYRLFGCENLHAETLIALAGQSGLRLVAIEAPQVVAGAGDKMRGLLLVLEP